MNGVIETSSGDLLRAGNADFENDGAFDAGTETYRTDVPDLPLIRGNPDSTNMHQWDGDSWEEVADPTVYLTSRFLRVNADPEITPVDALEGTLIVWGHNLYCKEDNGSTTNVLLQGHVDLRAGETGGSLFSLVPFATDPSLTDNDLFLREANGTVHLVFYDGTNKHILGASQSADICHIYASALGAADEITPATPENLLKGCTLADAGELGSHWTVENAASDTLELKYAGAQTKKFKVSMQVNLTSDEDGDVLSVWLYKGGTKQATSLHTAECVTGADGLTLRVESIIELAQNDTIRFLIDSDTGTPIVTPRSFTLTATPI